LSKAAAIVMPWLLTVVLSGAAATSGGGTRGAADSNRSSEPIFRVYTGDFWLNLHHFLYVLGRAEARMADATREAVATAPADQTRGLETLTLAEQQMWREAVRQYATGLSRHDAVFDRPLIDVGNALARAQDAASLNGISIDADVRGVLERVAPLYRKAWWSSHQSSNERWKTALDKMVHDHGQAVLSFITRAYGLPWSSGGYPIHVAAYANWAGAFSTDGPLLVISSLASANQGLAGLESAFHEAMHQWDDEMIGRVKKQAEALGVPPAEDLTHAMIFFTAGEAVRSIAPGHVTQAQAVGIWNRRLGRFKPILEAVWRPWLEGKGSREAAFAELVKRAAGL
jgi:hypothetical protein